MFDKQKTTVRPLVVVIGLCATALLIALPNGSRAFLAGNGEPNPQVLVPQLRLQIRVWLHGEDIRPKVIRSWPGTVQLTTENMSRRDTVLVIERILLDRSVVEARLPIAARVKRKTHEVALLVGEYMVYDESRPEVRSRILVAAR